LSLDVSVGIVLACEIMSIATHRFVRS
jgi:hypothetical protein